MKFLRNWLARGVLDVADDFEQRLAACEQQLGTLTVRERRTRMRALRDDPMVEEAVAALRASGPGGSAGMPAAVPVDQPETKGPAFLAVARKARS